MQHLLVALPIGLALTLRSEVDGIFQTFFQGRECFEASSVVEIFGFWSCCRSDFWTSDDVSRNRISQRPAHGLGGGVWYSSRWENKLGEYKNWLPMLLASVETGVYWPPGYYATGINFNRSLSGARMHFQPGAVLGGVVHMISGPQPRSFEITKIQRSAGVVTVNVKSAHSFQVGDSIQVRNVSGERSEFNGDRYRVTAADGVALQYIESKPDDVGALLRASAINETPLMNVRITGVLTTTDRLGTINCKNCYIESCWILNDPERHSAVPGGEPGRAYLRRYRRLED
nr:hypothetical protein [Pseudomonas sp. BIGb0427]